MSLSSVTEHVYLKGRPIHLDSTSTCSVLSTVCQREGVLTAKRTTECLVKTYRTNGLLTVPTCGNLTNARVSHAYHTRVTRMSHACHTRVTRVACVFVKLPLEGTVHEPIKRYWTCLPERKANTPELNFHVLCTVHRVPTTEGVLTAKRTTECLVKRYRKSGLLTWAYQTLLDMFT